MSLTNVLESMRGGVETLFGSAEAPVSEVVSTVRRSARDIVREVKLRDPLVYVEHKGNMPGQGGPLVVHYLGRKRFANDVLAFFDRETDTAQIQTTVRYAPNYYRFVKERFNATQCPKDADVLVVDRAFAFLDDGLLTQYVPFINAALPVQANMEAQLQLIRSKGHRRKLQSAVKKGFSWRKSHAIEDFNLFYDTMYEPFVKDRFRFDASIVPREEMLRVFNRRGFLLLVEEDGQPISGAMMYVSEHSPKSLNYWKYGLADGKNLSPNVFGERNSMTEAMVLTYALEQKFSEVDFGLTRAMPKDGIFTHKRRMGCDFRVPPGAPSFNFLLNPNAKARFLSRVPVVVQSNGRLQTWVGHEGALAQSGSEDFSECLRGGVFASMEALYLFCQHTDDATDSLLNQAAANITQDLRCVAHVIKT